MATKKFAMAIHTTQTSAGWLPANEEAVGATDGIPVSSVDLPLGIPTPMMNTEIGAAEPKEPQNGLIEGNTGSTQHIFRFEDHDEMLTAVMGADAVTQPDAGGSPTVYERVLSFAEQGLFAQLSTDTVEHGIHAMPAYLVGFELSAEMNGTVQITYNYMVGKAVIDGATNTQTVMDAVGYNTTGLIAVMTDADSHFRINAQSGGALGSTDDACLKSFSLSFQRDVQPSWCIGSDYTDLPFEQSFPECTFSVTLSRREDGTLPKSYGFLSPGQAGDPFKAELAIIGDQIENAFDNELKIEMPALTLNGDYSDSFDNPRVNEVTFPFVVSGAAAAPTGMTVTSYFEMLLRNTIATDFIA